MAKNDTSLVSLKTNVKIHVYSVYILYNLPTCA